MKPHVWCLPLAAILAACGASSPELGEKELDLFDTGDGPCPRLPGNGYPDLGSGHCTGNLFVAVPLSMGLVLAYNSAANPLAVPSHLGAGWTLSAERSVTAVGSALVFQDGMGTLVPLGDVGGELAPLDPRTSSSVFSRSGSSIVETDARGHRYIYEAGRLASEIDRNTNVIHYRRDGAGRLIAIENPFGPKIVISASQIAVERAGEITDTYQLTSTAGRVSSIRTPTGAALTFTYDANGRLERRVDADGVLHEYRYDADGRLAASLRAGSAPKFFHYSPTELRVDGDRPIRETFQTAQIIIGSQPLTTSLVSTASEGSRTASFVYDGAHRLSTITDELGRTTTFAYHAPGPHARRIRERIGADGAVDRFTYDTRGRVTLHTANGPTGTITQEYVYDAHGLPLSTKINGSVVEAIARDARGNALQVVRDGVIAAEATYDAHGFIVTTTDAAGRTTQLLRNAKKQVFATTDYLGRTSTYQYGPRARLTQITHHDQTVETIDYDALGLETTRARYHTARPASRVATTTVRQWTDGRLASVTKTRAIDGQPVLAEQIGYALLAGAVRPSSRVTSDLAAGTSVERTSLNGVIVKRVVKPTPIPPTP